MTGASRGGHGEGAQAQAETLSLAKTCAVRTVRSSRSKTDTPSLSPSHLVSFFFRLGEDGLGLDLDLGTVALMGLEGFMDAFGRAFISWSLASAAEGLAIAAGTTFLGVRDDASHSMDFSESLSDWSSVRAGEACDVVSVLWA